ncbi:hypothetical protein, partial [Nostocoides japonicum]|uniref:hypothetical protein n=1 Tax=Nostocoides japonicum TaxID=99481 RepID=UPI00065BB725
MPDPAPASSSAGRGSAPLEVHRDTRRGTVLVLTAAVGWSLAGLFTRSVAASSWAIIGWRGVFSAVAVVGWLVVGSPRARPPLDAGASGAQLSAGVRPPTGSGPSDDAQLCAGVRPPAGSGPSD